jgi:hypothetical protein
MILESNHQNLHFCIVITRALSKLLETQSFTQRQSILLSTITSPERNLSGEIRLTYIPTGEQVADLFTKPLGRFLFEKFRTKLQIMSVQEAGLPRHHN